MKGQNIKKHCQKGLNLMCYTDKRARNYIISLPRDKIVSTYIFSGGYGQQREMEGFFARVVTGGTGINGLTARFS